MRGVNVAGQFRAEENFRQARAVHDGDGGDADEQAGEQNYFGGARAFVPEERAEAEQRRDGGGRPVRLHARVQAVKPVAVKQRRTHAREE